MRNIDPPHLNILARSRDPAPGTILSIPQALKLTHEPIADCARYDSLRGDEQPWNAPRFWN
jgi:hypothetical protein